MGSHFVDRDADLLHAVTLADGDGVVLLRVVVHADLEYERITPMSWKCWIQHGPPVAFRDSREALVGANENRVDWTE